MRAKSFILLLLALGCGLVASIGITQVMAKKDPEPAVISPDQVKVFVALKEIRMGDPIAPQLVKLEAWPKSVVPQGAFTSDQELDGRRAKTLIPAGSPILETQLLAKGEEVGPSRLIPKGYRAFPVKVDAASCGGGIIRPADRVDVLVHLKTESGKAIAGAITKTVLQDVKVFDIDGKWDVNTADEKMPTAKTISLLVTPEQSQVLNLAAEMGSLRLVLRSPDDKEQKSLGHSEGRELLGGALAMNEREPPLPQPKAPDAGDAGSKGILDWLNKLNNKKDETKEPPQVEKAEPQPVPQIPVEPKEVFTVRILAGSEVSDTVLEASKNEKSGTQVWTPASSTSTSGPSHAAAIPAVKPPAPAAVKPPVPASKPPADDDEDEKASTKSKGKENQTEARSKAARS